MRVLELLLKYPPESFTAGRLVLLTHVRAEVFVLLAVLGAAATWLLYRRVSGKLSRPRRRALVAVRTAALALLLVLLAAPALSIPNPRRSSVYTAVLVDTSRSMSIGDADAPAPGAGEKARLEAAREVLLGASGRDGLLKRLGDNSNLVLYAFDRGAMRVSDPRQLRPDGRFANLFRAVRDVEEDLRGLTLASVVMLTDGCRNEGGSAEETARLLQARGAPLHVVGVGNANPPKDYEVSQVFAPAKVRRNTEVDVYATVRSTGFNEPFDVTVSRDQTVLLTQRVAPEPGVDIRRVRLSFTPDVEGLATYRVSVPASEEESVRENNFAEFTLQTQDNRLPVLYIEGSPRLEYRFLRRALFRDKDFRLVGILRLSGEQPAAKPAGKSGEGGAAGGAGALGGKLGFYVQGANPSEMYLEKGFPTTREQLFAFQAVVLGDIEAGYFTPSQLALLEEFVRVRGGGVLMLGGVNSFGLGKYAGTPIEQMLPVAIGPHDPPYSDETFKAQVAPDALRPGNPHLLMRLSNNEDINQRLWESAPPLVGITPVRGLKAGATALLMHEKRNLPVLAVQEYGQGRVAAFTSGGSWYWRMSLPAKEEFHEKFWKQVVRWLVVGVKERISAETTAAVYAPGQEVTVRATVFGKDLQPLNDARTVATITDPSGNAQEVRMDWVLSEEGVYQCQYVPNDEGDYRVAVRVEGRGAAGAAPDEEWAQVKPAETQFRASEPLVEFNNAGLKEDLLRRLAAATQGEYYRYGHTGELAENVLRSVRAVKEGAVECRTAPLWDMPLCFVAILALMGADWTLRRKSGLA